MCIFSVRALENVIQAEMGKESQSESEQHLKTISNLMVKQKKRKKQQELRAYDK